jgi:hypothetical protein
MVELVEQKDLKVLQCIIAEQKKELDLIRKELNLVKAIQKDHINQIQYLHNGVKNLEQGKADRGWNSTPPVLDWRVPPGTVISGIAQGEIKKF